MTFIERKFRVKQVPSSFYRSADRASVLGIEMDGIKTINFDWKKPLDKILDGFSLFLYPVDYEKVSPFKGLERLSSYLFFFHCRYFL